VARIAFIMGSNGPGSFGPLKYAESDAEHVAEALGGPRCKFEISRPQQTADPYELRRDLDKTLSACKLNDTVVCYFAGHGVLEAGELYLIWHDTTSDLLTTALPVEYVLNSMRRCRARNRLLILDCCHAGGAVGTRSVGPVPVEELAIASANHLVLMASGRLEKTREYDRLGGGFLTTMMCEALTTSFHEADDDGDLMLSIDDMMHWLDECVSEGGTWQGETASLPRLFGEKQGEFYFTEFPLWTPYEIDWPDGSTLVVLPTPPFASPRSRRRVEYAVAIGKYPITNRQYKTFLEQKPRTNPPRGKEPIGEHFDDLHKRWSGPFYPWQDPRFRGDDLPVVCVSYADALDYCRWANSFETVKAKGTIVDLVPYKVWDLAAFGSLIHDEYGNVQDWRGLTKGIHHKADGPAEIDLKGERRNSRGVSDLIGNVWEWCGTLHGFLARHELEQPSGRSERVRLRGGGFLDDLEKVRPFLNEYEIRDRGETRHSDLGFRVAGLVPIDYIPEELRQQLSLFPNRRLNESLETIALLGENSDF